VTHSKSFMRVLSDKRLLQCKMLGIWGLHCMQRGKKLNVLLLCRGRLWNSAGILFRHTGE